MPQKSYVLEFYIGRFRFFLLCLCYIWRHCQALISKIFRLYMDQRFVWCKKPIEVYGEWIDFYGNRSYAFIVL